jgi:hypothetical protein
VSFVGERGRSPSSSPTRKTLSAAAPLELPSRKRLALRLPLERRNT